LIEISLCAIPANSACRVTEVRSLNGFGSLEQRLAALDAQWAAESLERRNRLADFEVRISDALVAGFKSGEITGDATQALLRKVLDGQKAALHL
jgi:hypothetical protein